MVLGVTAWIDGPGEKFHKVRGEPMDLNKPARFGRTGNEKEGVPGSGGRWADQRSPAGVSLNEQPSETARRKKEHEATAEAGGVLEEGGKVVDVCGAGATCPRADRPDDRVVADVPEERAGGAAHAKPPPKGLGEGGLPVDDPSNTPFGHQIEGRVDKPKGQTPPPEDVS